MYEVLYSVVFQGVQCPPSSFGDVTLCRWWGKRKNKRRWKWITSSCQSSIESASVSCSLKVVSTWYCHVYLHHHLSKIFFHRSDCDFGGRECLCWSLSIGFTAHCNINLGWTWAPYCFIDRDLFTLTIDISSLEYPATCTDIGWHLWKKLAILASSAKLLWNLWTRPTPVVFLCPFGPETGSSSLFPSVCHLKFEWFH